ncbi:MAG: DnaJ C-terminal domain-containing protein [Xanthomonadales bacterium]|nr:DnaJ C-terminal domain-containing protein [Xanthomonadales bacterium]
MKYKDYYEIMGVPREASQVEIKKAYRKKARKYHPDVSKDKNAEERFKELGEAYAVLKDPEKRKAYDQLGANWQAGQDFRPPPGWQESAGFGRGGGFDGFGAGSGRGAEDFSDFFEELFGGGFSRAGGPRPGAYPPQGQDVHARISIDIRDSYTGATRSLQMQLPEATPDGRVFNRQRVLNVTIPKGIRQGQQIRLKGQGGQAPGSGQSGDLYLEVEFRADDHFHAEGKDVYLNLPVAPWEAALGGKVTVPLPSGHVDMNIPANSASGRKLRLKGKGLPGKSPGDLYVVLNVVFPPAHDKTARQIYQEMRDKMSFDPRAGMRRS